MEEFFIHVAVSGSNSGNGTLEKPFATLQRAAEEIKNIKAENTISPITVLIHKGMYTVDTVELTEEISGTKEAPVTFRAYNDERPVFTNAKVIPSSLFKRVEDKNILKRLSPIAAENVLVCDLKEAGITHEDVGEINPEGAYNNEGRYADGRKGINSELFWGEKRMYLARYPNFDTGYTRIKSVIDMGEPRGKENPRGGTVGVSDDLKSRMKKWSHTDEIYAYGKFFWEWADTSSRISSFDENEGTLTFAHVSGDGYRENNPYFVYNILEELDCPGEYYIDRENLLLYAYKPDGITNENAYFTVNKNEVLKATGVKFVNIEGLDFCGSKQCSLRVIGENCTVKNCRIYNTTGIKPSAVDIEGMKMKFTDSEVFNISRNGVSLVGGVLDTLTRSENVIENCYIHSFGQMQRTSIFGARLEGIGNTLRHCELSDSPHSAICYFRNYNIIEYNHVHDVCTEVSDGGALYIGGTYANLGSEIRYNFFENIGNETFFANAIYFDDGMSGQVAYGNVVKNVCGAAFLLGGGAYHHVYNNLMINCKTTLFYDDRFAENGWAPVIKSADIKKTIVYTLFQFPWQSPLFQERFPFLKDITIDIKDYKDPHFPANPAFTVAENNIADTASGEIALNELVDELSSIERPFKVPNKAINHETMQIDEKFLKDNNIKWEQIPFDKIGRYKK